MDYFLQYPILTGLGSFALGLFGLRMLIRATSVTAGLVTRRLLNRLSPSPLQTWWLSLPLNLLLLSPNVSQVFWLSFTNTGLLSLRQALVMVASSFLPLALLLLLLLAGFGFPAWAFLAFGGLGYFVFGPQRLRGAVEFVFSYGLTLLAFQTLVFTFSTMTVQEPFRPFVFFLTDDSIGTLLILFVSSFLLSFWFRATSFSIFLSAAALVAGVISLGGALSLVFGEMLATGVLLALQSRRCGRSDGRRLALFSITYPLLFMLLTIIVLPVVSPFLKGILLSPQIFPVAVMGYLGVFMFWLSSLFVIMALLGILISGPTQRMLKSWGEGEKGSQKLLFIGPEMGLSPALAIELLNEEVIKLSTLVYSMVTLTAESLSNSSGDDQDKEELSFQAKVVKYEEITDNVQDEVQAFLIKLTQHPMLAKESEAARALMKITSSLESIADACRSIVTDIVGLEEHITSQSREEFQRLLEQVKSAYEDLFGGFDVESADTLNVEDQGQKLKTLSQNLKTRAKGDELRARPLDPLLQPLALILEKMKNIQEAKKLMS